MKQGISTEELTREILRQKEAKADYVADTRQLRMTGEEGPPVMELEDQARFTIGQHAHRQIAERLRIPVRYYNLMLGESPELLARNVNHWFQEKPERRMVRTLDGNVRAFLSDRYRRMDHHDLAEAVLPVLGETGASLVSADIGEDRMYLKAVIREVQATVPAPQGNRQTTPVTVSPGIVISNSETGNGALAVSPAVHFLACTNLAVWAQNALRKYHVGRVNAGGGDAWAFLSDETRRMTDAALWAQVRDLTRGALQGDVFESIVQDLKEARGEVMEDGPAAIEKLGLPEGEQRGILQYLVEGGDLSRFGLSNAVTRFSQDVESYERASDLERIGGEIIAAAIHRN